MYESMAETMAGLHGVAPTAVGLGDFGKPGNYFARQVARWNGTMGERAGPAPTPGSIG